MTTKVLRFVRIVNNLCSCGREIGKLQGEIEFSLLNERGEFDSNDEIVSDYLTKIGITKMCCRISILMAPVYQINSNNVGVFKYYREKGSISEDLDELVIHPIVKTV